MLGTEPTTVSIHTVQCHCDTCHFGFRSCLQGYTYGHKSLKTQHSFQKKKEKKEATTQGLPTLQEELLHLSIPLDHPTKAR